MEKQLSILFNTSRNLAISEFVSNPIPRKDLSAIVMLTSPELGISNSLNTIQALQNPVADGSYFMLVAQSSGHQNFKRRLPSWPPKLALSTTKAEYIAMSQALRYVLPIMFLIQEIKVKRFQVICTKSYIYCKVFEVNSGALELARLLKLCLRTKHINMCYHHFCKHVRNGLIKIFPIGTKD